MNSQYEDREQLIEAIGVAATDAILEIRDELFALRDYLGVEKVYSTKGYKFVKSAAKDPSPDYMEMVRKLQQL